ncbi:DUF2627 domain-containing protein [Fictibacillus gelatini]|uniref:DUF2627 domain-containing protein n=1 Tax=Fictibacillus gelatini TaxID=225985 RepID=UPI0004133F03|nr:DUF2627 domain-containing protein [Fictibacillus gelatini]
MQRFIALIIMVIPGIIAVIGIKLMRDVLFGVLHSPFIKLWLQFLAGAIFFAVGFAFVGGFIFYRDRKRNKVQPRFSKKRPL